MFETTTRVYIQDPLHEDNLVPGVIMGAAPPRLSVRFLQPFSLAPNESVNVFFYNPSNQFTKVPCRFQRMLTPGSTPTGTLLIDGTPQVAESRSAYRVTVCDNIVSATVNETLMAEVINISASGLGLVLDIQNLPTGQWVKVALRYDCDVHSGAMRICSVTPTNDGRFRYGLQADESDPTLIAQLTRIAQELQQIKARRASGLGAKNAPKPVGADDDNSTTDAKKTSETITPEEQAESPDGTQRQHLRNRWPGKAKVYIRENENIRILSVETVDLSKGGLSFKCPQFIYDASEVLFEKPISGGLFRVCGVVRSCIVEKNGWHRIGLQFAGAPLKPGEVTPAFEMSQAA